MTEETPTPTETPVPETPVTETPPPADVPVVEPTPDEPTPEPTPDEPKAETEAEEREPGTPFVERIGAPFARLTKVSGPPVVALAAATFVLFVLTVLLALMVFAPGAAPVRLGSSRAGYLAQRDVAIEKVAVRFAHNLLTFDYRTVDRDLNRLQADSTGSFVKQLKEVRGSKQVIDAVRKQHAQSTGVVRGASVQSVRGDTATVRVFLARTVRNIGLKEPRNTLENVDLTLVKTSKGWKIDAVG
jgi:Mce-associated membrane protein